MTLADMTYAISPRVLIDANIAGSYCRVQKRNGSNACTAAELRKLLIPCSAVPTIDALLLQLTCLVAHRLRAATVPVFERALPLKP